MSELAFNIQGERFEPPASATYWRVRRLKPGGRGTPDVMFGADGAPLMIAIDTELSEFQELVKNEPGRYRLDPVDDSHKSCEGAIPAYLQISAVREPAADSSIRNTSAFDPGSSLAMMELLVRANTEMVKSIAERFAGVMDSAATLIRAADGAGLPAREPRALGPEVANALRNAAVDQELDDQDDEDDEHPHLAAVLQTAVDRAMPLLSHTINTKVLGLSTEQSIALMGGTVPAANANGRRSAEPEKPARKATRNAESAPASPPDFMRHVMAVEALLSPEEAQLARQAIAQMPPEVLAAWRERLLRLTPVEAAKMVRDEIQKNPTSKKEAA